MRPTFGTQQWRVPQLFWVQNCFLHGQWQVLYFPLLLFFSYFFLLFVGSFLFFVFMSLDSSLSNQEPILISILSFCLIVKIYRYCYGSFTLYHNILLNWIIEDYFILQYHQYLFSIVFVIVFLFSFSIFFYFYLSNYS